MWEIRKQPRAALLVGASVGMFRRDDHRVRRARQCRYHSDAGTGAALGTGTNSKQLDA